MLDMYRTYEDPYELEEQLAELKKQRANATDENEIECLALEIHELEERVNFAWQDDEYLSDLLLEQQEQM